MLAHIDALTVLGVDAYVVHVECDVTSNFSAFSVVGLPDAAVRESVDRVRTALKNSVFIWPQRRITVNLAPADTRKQGPLFDLPIALGVLQGDEQCHIDHFPSFAAIGEMGLDGSVRPISGVLPMALGAKARGLPVIGVVSVPHCSQSKPAHSSGQKLIDIADIVAVASEHDQRTVATSQHLEILGQVLVIGRHQH